MERKYKDFSYFTCTTDMYDNFTKGSNYLMSYYLEDKSVYVLGDDLQHGRAFGLHHLENGFSFSHLHPILSRP